MARTPWALAARGAAAVAFGVLTWMFTFAWPAMTVAAFIGLFAAYALVDGALTLLTALRAPARARDPRGLRDPLFLLGAVGVAGGLLAALWSDVTMQALLGLMAAWAAATGALQLYVSTRARSRLPSAWLLGGAGAAGLAFAVLLVLSLAVGEVRVAWEVTAYGLSAGGLLVALAWRLIAQGRTADADTPVPAVAAEPAAP